MFAKAGGAFLESLLISGYRSYELNIFNQTDPKYLYLRAFLEKELKNYIENGVEWYIITGQLGIELWAGELIIELREENPDINLAVLLPYTSFGDNWNQENKDLFDEVIRQADYVNYTSNKDYESPKQLQANQAFVIENTDGAWLLYDQMTDQDGQVSKPKYLYDLIELYQERQEYSLQTASFDEIDFFVHEYHEMHGEIKPANPSEE